ncbi:MAG: NAD(P)-dependent oxidoreductase [Candidatus Altiarchaeota archaeon]|nr:NAD(P)-dependent oxidoreductase [Candidatus Altiarchaeota archaeon]
MRILVTGALGAVGKPLVEELEKRGHDVWKSDRRHDLDPKYIRCDISEYRQVENLIEKAKPEVVYNLAGEFGRMNGEDYYETLWNSNAVGMKNMLRLQEKKRFRLIHTSSSEVYGDYKGLMTEDVMMKYPIRQLNDYAISKWVNELQIMNSEDRSKTETIRLRLFNIYGPGEYYSPYRSVACLFIYHALHDMPYTVYLNHHRTSSYIDDAINAIANITSNFKPGEVYNICGDEYHDIKTVSDIILGHLGKDDSKVEYIKVEPHNTLDKKGDSKKAKKDLGYKTRIDLKEGLKRTIEWQREVYKV